MLRELTVEVDPSEIPNHIDVDVSGLELAQSLHVSDLPLPPGVTVLDDADATVCVVGTPRVVEEEAPAEEEATGAEPELIRKPKDEESEESE